MGLFNLLESQVNKMVQKRHKLAPKRYLTSLPMRGNQAAKGCRT